MEFNNSKGNLLTSIQRDAPNLWERYTLKEEYATNRVLDEHNRFAFSESDQTDVLSPIVSASLLERGWHPRYPGNKSFAVCLTHDIDAVFASSMVTFKRFGSSVKRQNISAAIRHGATLIDRRKNNLYQYIYRLLELEQKYGGNSSFYFLSLKNGERDFNFDVKEVKSLFKAIDKTGSEIGLHGGHDAYNNLAKLKAEKANLEDALGKSVIGYRNHYLKFNTPLTWEILEAVGFAYDTTVGYADMYGFRNGMCHPYYPYNNRKQQFHKIMELPLIYMDVTLSRYLNMTEEEIWKAVRNLINTIKAHKGVLTINWHNKDDNQDLGLYEKILQYSKNANAWITSGEQVYHWWKDHNLAPTIK